MRHYVGLLSVSDMRGPVHASQAPYIEGHNDLLVRALEATGEVEMVRGCGPITSPSAARREARRLLMAGVGGTIFHQPTFGYPHLAVVAAQILPPPSWFCLHGKRVTHRSMAY